MKSSMVFPYEILNLNRIRSEPRDVIIKQWSDLPDIDIGEIVPVIDVSGSMSTMFNSSVSLMDIAISLGLFIALKNGGDFITFSEDPQLIHLDPSKDVVD